MYLLLPLSILTELHRSALSEEPLSTVRTDPTQDEPQGGTADDRASKSESCSSDSELDSLSSADTVITRESNGAIRVTSRVQSRGDGSCDNRTVGVNGALSLGRIIDDKLGRDGCDQVTANRSARPSSERDSEATHGDTESKEEGKMRRQEEPTALESLVSIISPKRKISEFVNPDFTCSSIVLLLTCSAGVVHLTALCHVFICPNTSGCFVYVVRLVFQYNSIHHTVTFYC